MKTNCFSKTKLAGSILSVLISAFSYTLFAQEPYQAEEPGILIQDDGSLKSTQAAAWWASNNGSDYFMYFTWQELYSTCPCDKMTRMQVWRGGQGGTLVVDEGWEYGPTYKGDEVYDELGPDQLGIYYWEAPVSGHTYLIASWLDCWYACNPGSWKAGGNYYRYTAPLKPPKFKSVSDRISDQYIKLEWTRQTDVPTNKHTYRIYKDGGATHVAEVSGSTTSWIDRNVGPGETHTYHVRAYAATWNKYSTAVEFVGHTFDLGMTASTNEPKKIILSWNSTTGMHGYDASHTVEKFVLDRRDGNQPAENVFDNIASDGTTKTDDAGSLIPGYEYTYILTPYPKGDFHTDSAVGKMQPNGKFDGRVIAPSGNSGVAGVRVCAIRQDSIPQDTTTTYCDITDQNGSFEITNIYYYTSASFKIIPYKEGHGFNPASQEFSLDLDDTKQTVLDIVDTSAFTISGQITQPSNMGTCYMQGAEILVDGNVVAETDHEGKYSLSVDQIADYTISAQLEGHAFDPAEQTLHVVSDTGDVNFLDTTVFVLEGYLRASCNIYIGQGTMKVYASKNPQYCFDTIIETDTLTGYYQVELPAREYAIEILSFESESEEVQDGDVEGYFTVETVDLTFGDIEKDFIYRGSPKLTVTGFDVYGCGDFEDNPILVQGERTVLEFEVRETFGQESCLADTGYLIIYNGLVNESNRIDTVLLDSGMAKYEFRPGYPNIISPYLKHFEVRAVVEEEEDLWMVDALIEGNQPREQTFTTVSPELPFMILRDPPGDGSYSYLSEGTTTQTALRFSTEKSGSLNAWAQVKAGAKFESGFGVTVETEIWGSVKGSLEVGAKIVDQHEFALSITNSKEFSTSDNPDVIGEGGDIIAGSALNLIYALSDVITYDPATCSVKKTVDLSMGTDGFATTFIYTDSHIRNKVIPDLMFLRNYYEMAGSDSAMLYENQIKVWNQTLNLNEDLKKKSEFLENITVSALTKYEASKEISKTLSGAIEFSLYIEAGVAIEAGVEVGGVGVSGGVEAKFRTEWGGSRSGALIATRKTGYVLYDDDEFDSFTIDICADKVYGTPVFKLVAGESSCPWEPGTLPREGVQLISDTYNETVEDPDGQAVFHLQLGNTSQSDEPRFYNLVFYQASNPDAAAITCGGSPVQGGILTPYYIPAGGSKEATVTVKRGPEAWDYNDLQFALISGCGDGAIADTVHLNAHFESPCSRVSLTKPKDDWSVAGPDNNKLKIRLQDYDTELLEYISLQYATTGMNNWTTLMAMDKDNLDLGQTDLILLFEDVPDGVYDLRAVVECNVGRVYSDLVTGRVDRTAPGLFGIPEPEDLVLDSGDLVIAEFDEEINCLNLTKGNITLTNITQDSELDFEFGCFGSTVLIIPDAAGAVAAGDTLTASVSGVEDMFGNVMNQPVSWSFTIPDPGNLELGEEEDTDEDGVLNKDDNCPYAANAGQEDLDTDGKGDKCDDDIDADGVLNYEDNCTYVYNPGQEDLNEDGIGDICQDFTFIADPEAVSGLVLYENYPEPFADETLIKYSIANESQVILRVYDLVGNLMEVLVDHKQAPGDYEITWDSREFSSGIYFYSIYAKPVRGNRVFMQTRKMVLSR